MTNRDQSCVLCGVSSHDVTTGLIAWRQPVGRDVFTAAPRCNDSAACRERVEALGERWEVVDHRIDTRDLIQRDRR